MLPLATRVILIVTGDIAQSGKTIEYGLAKDFIGAIATDIESRHGLAPEYDHRTRQPRRRLRLAAGSVRTRVLKTLKAEPAASIELEDVEECVSIFDAYEAFAKDIETGAVVTHSPIWRTLTVDVGDNSLQVHCVNNAWSCEMRTEPGSLGFPTKIHLECADATGDLRILLMHHPAHWIASRQYREFRRFTRECAEICFTGHEHESNAGANRDSETGLTLYVEGAVLQERGNPAVSGFNASLIDFHANNIETTKFSWNGSVYNSVGEPFVQALPSKANVVNLKPEWLDFITDLGSNVSHQAREQVDLADLYVYPELEQQNDADENPIIASSKDLSQELTSDSASTLIKGDQSSGKTALLKRLYADAVERELYPIYINGARLKSSAERDIQRLIERCAGEQYAHDSVSKVLQAKPETHPASGQPRPLRVPRPLYVERARVSGQAVPKDCRDRRFGFRPEGGLVDGRPKLAARVRAVAPAGIRLPTALGVGVEVVRAGRQEATTRAGGRTGRQDHLARRRPRPCAVLPNLRADPAAEHGGRPGRRA